VLEEVDATVAVARHVVEVARPPVLLLSSSCDLELLPRTVADRKVQVLGEATLRLRQELGC
jgi:methionine synthase II (cobalamin-independent)